MPAILCIYCTLGREVQSCANLVHWGKKYNLRKSCTYIAHWERSTILLKSCAYIALGKEIEYCANLAHWERSRILRIQCACCASCAKYTVSQEFHVNLLDPSSLVSYNMAGSKGSACRTEENLTPNFHLASCHEWNTM